MKANSINYFSRENLESFVDFRDGETKAGQKVFLPDLSKNLTDNLLQMIDLGVKYVLLFIPEDIGIKANFGRSGASEAPSAFCKYFFNMQHNVFLDFSQTAVLGSVRIDSIIAQADIDNNIDNLRLKTSQLDSVLTDLITPIFEHNLIPIIIGGGNNNSFGILKSLYQAKKSQINCLNIDSHFDFRQIEGRHSGNPFSYAYDCGYLKKYFILFAQENYNNQAMLDSLAKTNFKFLTYEDIYLRDLMTNTAVIQKVVSYFKSKNTRTNSYPFGLELDMDSISYMPSSAMSPVGVELNRVNTLIFQFAKILQPDYFYLSEASPKLGFDGERVVGKALASLVTSFIKGVNSAI